jgi:hypothetical protein
MLLRGRQLLLVLTPLLLIGAVAAILSLRLAPLERSVIRAVRVSQPASVLEPSGTGGVLTPQATSPPV